MILLASQYSASIYFLLPSPFPSYLPTHIYLTVYLSIFTYFFYIYPSVYLSFTSSPHVLRSFPQLFSPFSPPFPVSPFAVQSSTLRRSDNSILTQNILRLIVFIFLRSDLWIFFLSLFSAPLVFPRRHYSFLLPFFSIQSRTRGRKGGRGRRLRR